MEFPSAPIKSNGKRETVGKAIGKCIVLLLLIIILSLGGLLWFDYLGIFNMKGLFAPVYRLFRRAPQTSTAMLSPSQLNPDLDQDRLNKQRDALLIFEQELNAREENLASFEEQNQQLAMELAEREKNQAEREKTFSNTVTRYDDKNMNIESIAANLNGMAPANAVNILVAMDDQTVIDVLRKCDEIALRDGTNSLVSYWLSLMPADKAASIQRKMISKPNELN